MLVKIKRIFNKILLIHFLFKFKAGYVWGYNNNTYYKQLGQTPDQISSYLGIIPLVFGIIGSFVGGFVSDRVAKKAQPWTRIWVLVISQVKFKRKIFKNILEIFLRILNF